MISISKYTFGLFNDTDVYVEKQLHSEKKAIENLDLKKIIQVDFPDDQYYKTQTKKKQIVLHHTVSGQGVEGDISWWRSTAAHVATCMIVGWDGQLYQCFSSKYWGHHLGVHANNNLALNKAAIGIEIDSWGGLVRYNRLWYPAKWDKVLKKHVANTNIRPVQNVQIYSEGYRGFYGFEKYTIEQLESVRQLLVFWHSKYGIPLIYDPRMWEISEDALTGKSGIWSHTSFRKDKSDCHPQPELISMLKSFK